MPIFEYQCNDCKKTFDVLHKSLSNMEEVKCPSCGSSEYKKLFSSFSASVSNDASYSFGDHSCESGQCGIPSSGGCASGACPFN